MKKILTLFVLLLLIACAKEAVQQPQATIPKLDIIAPATLPEKPQYEPPPTTPLETGNTVEIKMETRNNEFLPTEIKANKGDKIKLTITAQTSGNYFTLPQFNVDRELEVGEDEIIEFLADKEGTFVFYSKTQPTMKGKITVT
ncbi:Cupredoxin-like domain protein [uncultured archaeon]|nr:Cupredoxin-like domain protein [uncultured archaeon]